VIEPTEARREPAQARWRQPRRIDARTSAPQRCADRADRLQNHGSPCAGCSEVPVVRFAPRVPAIALHAPLLESPTPWAETAARSLVLFDQIPSPRAAAD